MAENLLNRWWGRLTRRQDKETFENVFNKAFYQYIGGKSAQYDYKDTTYLTQGFLKNPDVYSIISQQSTKIQSIPYYVQEVQDEKSYRNISQLDYATKGSLSIPQTKRRLQLKQDAFSQIDKVFPMDRPNPNQTWADVIGLYETYMQITGNFYLYKLSPDEGVNQGVPQEVYVLPAHLMKIIIKDDADILTDENVISHYMLRQGSQYIEFDREDVIHIKLPNPDFNFVGGHLYGLSPLSVLLRNIESSNDAIDHNVKTMKNSGVFGFVHARDVNSDGEPVMTETQAMQIKDKLRQMDRDSGRLSHIAGASVPMAFTKLSMSTNELKPFDFLQYDQKQIANALGWDDLLLNNKDESTYNNLKTAQRNVVINHIVPRLKLLEESLTHEFIRLFRGYENAVIEFDYTELPEMQENIKELLEGYEGAYLTPNEKRELVKYEPLDMEGMDEPWIDGNKRRISEAGLSNGELSEIFGE